MNVIVSNKQQAVLENLDLDIIKSMNGEFEVDELISTFKNFFYQRMILDITAIKNYRDIKNLQKLSISLDMEKIILLLDDSPETATPDYLSKLISIGIYNFTKNAEGIMYLYNNPNTYRDVAQYHQLDNVIVEQVVTSYNRSTGCRVIGVKNLTDSSGATTLCYIMAKQLKKNYNVMAIEVDSNNFNYFNNRDLLKSVTSNELAKTISNNKDKDVIFVDVNNSQMAMGTVQEMLYLVEPSTLKLNKLMYIKRDAFKQIKDQKVILNQSLLTSKDVLELEYEARTKFFFNMPPLDEREKNIKIVNTFLARFGFPLQQPEEEE